MVLTGHSKQQPTAPGCRASRLHLQRWAVAIFVGALAVSSGFGAAVIVAGNSSVNMTKDDGPRNVTVGFFDDTTGERIGRLKIGLMTLDYRHQGVFRVAWKPQIILTGVTLEVNDAAACRTVGAQMPEALRSIGASGSLVMRDVALEIQQPAVLRVEAHGAEFTDAGDLIFRQARRSDESAETGQNFLFRLNGNHAGSIETIPVAQPQTSNPAQTASVSKP